MTAKETVLIVHGTFSGPVEGKPSWYEPGNSFCRQLDEQLATKGSSARCWSHLDECGDELKRRAGRDTPYFSWSGRNSWIDRSAAAKQFWAEIEYLTKEGWKCHVVAHSHGGNVVLEALDLENPYRQGGLSSNYVLLGTPILQFSAHLERWQGLFERFREYTTPSIKYSGPRKTIPGREASFNWLAMGMVVSTAFWVLLIHQYLKFTGLSLSFLLFENIKIWVVSIGTVIVMAALYWYYRHITTKAVAIMHGLPALREMFMTYPPRLLFINSQRDEAFCFLNGIRTATLSTESPEPNKGRKRNGVMSSWFRTIVKQAEEADRQRYPWFVGQNLWISGITVAGIIVFLLLGFLQFYGLLRFFASSFLITGVLAALTIPGLLFSVITAPWRFAEVCVFVVKNFVLWLANELGRRLAWNYLQGIALGISGSPHRLDEVSVVLCPKPEFARGEFLYQDLAKTAEDMAVAERSNLLHSEFRKIKEQSDDDFWRLDKWRERIGTIASDPTLVHTVYYRHPDVIDQIASHLVRSGKELYTAQLRIKAIEQNEPSSWEAWSKTAIEALNDNLVKRDPIAARTLLDDMRAAASTRNEAPLWKHWASAAVILMDDLGSRDPAATRILLSDMHGVASALDELALWQLWATAALNLTNDLRNDDPIAVRAILNEMHCTAADHDDANLWEQWAKAAINLMAHLRSHDALAARTLLDEMRNVAATRNDGALWEWWAKAAAMLSIVLASSEPVAAQALLGEIRIQAEECDDATLWELWDRTAYDLAKDLQSNDPVAALELLDAMRGVAEARDDPFFWEIWAKSAGNLMIELPLSDLAAAFALFDEMRIVAAKRNEALLWELWATVAHNLVNNLRSLDITKALALIADMRSTAVARDDTPLWELWAKAIITLMIDLPACDPTAARNLLEDLHAMAGTRGDDNLWELWAQAAFNLIVGLGTNNPAISRELVGDMIKEVEKNPGEVGGWQTKVVGLLIQAAFNLTKNQGLRDSVAARTLCAEVLGLPEEILQLLHFED